ncbi:MAG: hypothetical protein EOP04_24300 [Proteobacteria bacterium]|nr:MAG: hypothetical protein EOP04_24300 [Pseudomonadota bacterium]
MNKSALQVAIRATFEEVPYPGNNNIGIPDSVGGDDADDVSEGFRGVDWRTLTSNEDLWGLGLHFMTAEAAHYYLPAYLLVGIEDPVREAMLGALLRLKPYLKSDSDTWPQSYKNFLQFVSLLSPSQKKVIADTLVYALDTRIKALLKHKEAGPSPDEDQSPDDITEEEREEDRAWWDEQIEDTRAKYAPLIEYWSHT